MSTLAVKIQSIDVDAEEQLWLGQPLPVQFTTPSAFAVWKANVVAMTVIARINPTKTKNLLTELLLFLFVSLQLFRLGES